MARAIGDWPHFHSGWRELLKPNARGKAEMNSNLFVMAVTLGFTVSAASADEVTETLQNAIGAYEEGDIQYALEELAYAQQLLKEMKSGELEEFLPEAPAGWTRTIDPGEAAGLAVLGGTGASAIYQSDAGSRFTLNIMVDNPMITGMAGIFSNPAVLASQGKLGRVGREKFLIQGNQLTGKIDGRIMIQAEGAVADEMIPIIEQIDFRELGRFGF